jgi:hypothetical protein
VPFVLVTTRSFSFIHEWPDVYQYVFLRHARSNNNELFKFTQLVTLPLVTVCEECTPVFTLVK